MSGVLSPLVAILTTSGVLSPFVADGPSATSELRAPDVVRMNIILNKETI